MGGREEKLSRREERGREEWVECGLEKQGRRNESEEKGFYTLIKLLQKNQMKYFFFFVIWQQQKIRAFTGNHAVAGK